MTQETKTGMPTPEELQLVRDAVLLPHMLTIAQEKRQEMELSSHAFKALFVKAIDVLMDFITRDLTAVRREMAQRKIRVVEDGQRNEIVYHKIFCRGYEDSFGMVREVMRAELSVRFPKYMKRIFDGL